MGKKKKDEKRKKEERRKKKERRKKEERNKMAGKLMCWAGQHFHDFSADVLDALVSVIGSTICRMFNKVPSSYSSNSSNSSSASPPSSEYFLTEQQCIIPSQS